MAAPQESMTAIALEARALSAAYGKTRALDGLSATVPGGAIVALLGENGSGKSTLLKVIARILPPVGGDLLLALLGALSPLQSEQRELPVVRAHSRAVDVREGDHFRAGAWSIDPALALDVFYARRSDEERALTFTTDLDSITFEVKPGEEHDFVFLLDGHACRTRLSTMRRAYRDARARENRAEAAIPIAFGRDGKLHLEGRVNGSAPLDFMFDTGADTVVLYPSAIAAGVAVEFDGTTLNSGWGLNTRRTSAQNRLELAGLEWDHVGLMYIEAQTERADGIVGGSLFEDKVVELDYERMLLILHDALPAPMEGYARLEMAPNSSIALVQATLDDGRAPHTDWLVVDSGSGSTLNLSRGFAERNALYGPLELLGTSRSGGVGGETTENEVVLLPALRLGDFTTRDVPAHRALPDSNATATNALLGMEVLKRFHTFLDYPGNALYLKPDALFDEPYRRDFGPGFLPFAVGAAVLALVLAVVVRRAKQRA